MSNNKVLNDKELKIIYELLDEYSDNLDKLLGDEYATRLYDIYVKLRNRFGE